MHQVVKITPHHGDGSELQAVRGGPRNVYLLSYGVDTVERFESIGLLELWDGLRARRWLIASVTVFAVAIAIAYAFLAPELYRSSALVSPADSKAGAGIAGQLGGLGGLASLAGIELGSGNEEEPIAILNSRELARDFIESEGLLPVIFADKWDVERSQWKSLDQADHPDIRDAVKVFDERVRMVQQDKKTGLVTVEMTWRDPDVAAVWAKKYIDLANQRIRDRDMRESEARMAFLRKQLAEETVVSMQQSLSRLLEAELQKVMLARARPDYAFRLIDPPTIPKHRSSPKRLQIVALAAVAGAMFGILLALAGTALRRLKSMQSQTASAPETP